MNHGSSNSNNQRSRSSQSSQDSQDGYNTQANYGPHTGYSQTTQTHCGCCAGQQAPHALQQGHGQAYPAGFYRAQQLPRIPNYTAEDYPFPTGQPYDPAPKMYPVLDHKDNGTLFAAHAQWEAAVGADRAKAAAAQRQAQGQGQRSATPDSGNPSSASKAQPKKK